MSPPSVPALTSKMAPVFWYHSISDCWMFQSVCWEPPLGGQSNMQHSWSCMGQLTHSEANAELAQKTANVGVAFCYGYARLGPEWRWKACTLRHNGYIRGSVDDLYQQCSCITTLTRYQITFCHGNPWGWGRWLAFCVAKHPKHWTEYLLSGAYQIDPKHSFAYRHGFF